MVSSPWLERRWKVEVLKPLLLFQRWALHRGPRCLLRALRTHLPLGVERWGKSLEAASGVSDCFDSECIQPRKKTYHPMPKNRELILRAR